MDTFSLLSSSRNSGMGLGAIPLSEVKAYIELYVLRITINEFVVSIRKMDDAFLTYHNTEK